MRKQILILILCGLMLSLSTVFIHQIGATDSDSASESTQANTTATVFAEGFEGAFPGSWSVGDSNAASGLDYWYDTNYAYHTGSWSGWCAQSGIQSTSQIIWTEGFEGAFPGTSWDVTDWNSANGYDYWSDTSYFSGHTGIWAGWCAQVGTHARTVTIFTEGFEGAFPGTAWNVGDWNSANGYDYWDDTNFAGYQHSGSWSGWCAQVGTQPNGVANSAVHIYDNNMNSYMYRYVGSLTGYTSVTLSYWSVLSSEPGYDFLQVMYYADGAWSYVDAHTGNLWTWHYSTVTIPTTATYVGFRFYSDASNVQQGAYIDDISLYATEVPNTYDHHYDDNMDSVMYRYASLSGYASVTLSYYWAINCDPGYDYLQVMYYAGGAWNYVDTHTGNLWTWHYSTVTIPTTATYVGFRFHSDYIYHDYPGALIDDISLSGYRYNSAVHQYDDNMDAYMYRSVGSLTGYTSVSLSYWYWLSCESSLDYLQVMYYAGGAWHYVDTRSGSVGGWYQSTVAIPTTATYVGFWFHSDSTNHNYAGAYLDDIVCTGTTPTLNTVHLESRQDTGSTSNLGTITFAGTTYTLPINLARTAGGYVARYNAPAGYEFKSWQTSGSISVSSATANPTTATVTGSGTLRAIYRRVFFADGFESGSFSAWTGTGVTSGETRTVTSALRYSGTYSALFTSNGGGGTERAYCYKTITSQPSLYARAYFRVATSGIADNGDSFYLMVLKAGTNSVAFAGWRKTAGVVRWFLQIRSGTGYASTYSAATPSLNVWYRVEIRWVNNAASGLGQLWVNGALVCSITGKNTATYGNVNRLDFGLPQVTNCAATRAYLDSVKVSNTYI